LLSCLFASANGAKDAKPRDFNNAAQQLYALEAMDKISPAAAKTFVRLLDEQKIPGWALSFIDLDLIRAAAHG